MKHYPHHIGDFDKATRHLTRIERSVYRDLIDLYYDTEQRLTLDVAALCRRIVARSNEEATAVQQVLNEFFTETPTGWYHVRCEEEIDAYKANTSQKALAGKASAEAKRLKKQQAINGNSTPVEQPLNSVATADNGASTNQSTNQPINQEPIKDKGARKRSPSFDPAAIDLPDWLDRETWSSWCADRKKRGKPVTEKAAELQIKKLSDYLDAGHTPEAVIEHSIASSYQGLFAPKGVQQAVAGAVIAESFRERDERQARERWEQATGRTSARTNVIDITPSTPAQILEIEQ